MADIDIDHLRGWIGRETVATDSVTARLIDQYAAVLAPHLFEEGEAAAPALHWCLAPPATGMADLQPDGHPATGGFLPPAPLPRRMWAGGLVETIAPLRPGDTVTRTSRIDDVTLKHGRTGPLCFVTVSHRFATDRGLAIVDRQDIVYREAASTPAGPAAARGIGPAVGDGWLVETPPTLLFRYSALTFNAHRIHYDLPYATEAEGYAGLVVHGPLQASLLFNFCARARGAVPRRFAYRGLAPLIAGQPCLATGDTAADGSMAARIVDVAGATTMSAEASW